MASTMQLDEPDLPSLCILRWRHYDQRNLYVRYVQRRIVRSGGRARLRRSKRRVTVIAEDRHRIAPRKHLRIGRLELRDLRGQCVVHHVLHIRNKRVCCRRIGFRARLLISLTARQDVPLQLITGPFDAVLVPIVDVSLNNQIKVSGSAARPPARRPYLARNVSDIVGVPGYGSLAKRFFAGTFGLNENKFGEGYADPFTSLTISSKPKRAS